MGVYQLVGGTVSGIRQKIAVTTPVVVAGNANSAIRVPWFAITETAGSTPTLTIDLYDGTTATFLRDALAMTARQTFVFNEGLWLDIGIFLRITASSAVDVVGITSLPGLSA